MPKPRPRSNGRAGGSARYSGVFWQNCRLCCRRMIGSTFIPKPAIPRDGAMSRIRWMPVLGSVGQPRDRDPAASFAMFDTSSSEITYCRVPYDVEAAAKRIRENGLPLWLADRLLLGR